MNRDFSNTVLSPLRESLRAIKRSEKQIATNWSIITGSPLSGKTTIIKKLEKLGYTIAPDFGRIALEEIIESGKSKLAARADYKALQQKISDLQYEFLKNLDPRCFAFLDYGPPDNLAFLYYTSSISDRILLERSTAFGFRHCYILDPLELNDDADPVRIEQMDARIAIKELSEDIYRCLDIPITHIPPTDVDTRLNLIRAK